MKATFNIWHLEAYRGYSDYDGPEDCNVHKDLIMDASFSKEAVIKMWMCLNSDARSVAVAKCEIVGKGEAEV